MPLVGLAKLGLIPPSDEAQAYLAVWRHVGFYFGVKGDILARFFHSVEASESFLMSMVIHEFTPDEQHDPQAQLSPTLPILHAVSDRDMGASYEYNCTAARYFLGQELADRLEVPSAPLKESIVFSISLTFQGLLVRFGRVYGTLRPGWLERRRRVMSIGMPRVVRSQLGMRRTKYRPVAIDGNNSRGLDSKSLDDESVAPDYAGGKLLAKIWRDVIVEMGVVSAVVLFIPVALVWRICT